MSRGLRILHVADSHIGAQLPARPRRPAAAARGDDFVRSYERALARADEFDVDLVVHSGDVFDEPSPSTAAIAAAATPLLRLAARGVPVVIVPGNHERCVLPASLLFSHANVHIFDRPATRLFSLRDFRVAVVGIPCIRRGAAESFHAALDESGWQPQVADLHLLVAHQAFESATCGPASYRFRSGPDVVERSAVPDGFDYVAAGHIHRHQALAATLLSRAPIVYAGSPDRITFAEQREPKGCVLVEFDGAAVSHRFLEHAVRAMASLPLDVSGLPRERIREAVLEWVAGLPGQCLAQARLSGRTEPRHMRALALRELVQSKRPDLLFTAWTQAVQFVPSRELAVPQAAACPSVRPAPAPLPRAPSHDSRAHASEPTARPVARFSPPETTSSREPTRPTSPLFAIAGDIREIVRASMDQLGSLPASAGTYALFDAEHRLLYVGKAANLRARVRTHAKRPDATAFFHGWTARIVRIEARAAGSDLEAMLVEAELIRRHGPPFNREMRGWARYCYLCEGPPPFFELHVATDAGEDRLCFGPFRSRWGAAEVALALADQLGLASCPAEKTAVKHSLFEGAGGGAALCDRYFAGLCGGPCAGRVSASDYLAALQLRRAILAGGPFAEPAMASLFQAAEAWEGREPPSPTIRALVRRAGVLQAAIEHGRALRAARELFDKPIELSGADALAPLFARVCEAGLTFQHSASEPRVCDREPGLVAGERRAEIDPATAVIPKHLLDMLLTVVRARARSASSADSRSSLETQPV